MTSMNSSELFGIAGGFEGEAFDGGIDHARAEDLGFLEDRGARFLRACGRAAAPVRGSTAGASVRSVACSTLISLFICLITCGALVRLDVDHDGHAGELRVERARDRQALDVVAALR